MRGLGAVPETCPPLDDDAHDAPAVPHYHLGDLDPRFDAVFDGLTSSQARPRPGGAPS